MVKYIAAIILFLVPCLGMCADRIKIENLPTLGVVNQDARQAYFRAGHIRIPSEAGYDTKTN